MNNMATPEKEVMERLYIIEKMPMCKIAKTLNMSVGKVHKFFTLYGLSPRKDTNKGLKHSKEVCERISQIHKGKSVTAETREKISKSHKGVYRNKSEFGGHRKQRTDGYISVYAPNHEKATKDGYVMEHILIAEKHIGRQLTENEEVHHKNKIRNDNRIENLMVMTKAEHARLHCKEKWMKKKGLMTYQ